MSVRESTGFLARWADFLILRSRSLLILTVALIIVAWPISQRLVYQESIETLYAPDDPHLLDYLESKALFGGDELVLVAYSDPELFTIEGYERNRAFARQLAKVPGVVGASTQCLADAIAPVDANFIQRLLLRTKDEELKELFRGVFLGLEDDVTTAVVLRLHSADTSPATRTETFQQIHEVIRDYSPATESTTSPVIVGEPMLVHETFRYVREDGELLFHVSLGILGAVLLLYFRNLRWVLLPLLVVWATILFTKAILVLCGVELSMVSTLLNSLVTVISIATVMHITLHYRELRRMCDQQRSFRITTMEMTGPIFWTTTTTMAGFASLLSSRVVPVQSFGLTMSLGTVIVLAAVVGLVPAGTLKGKWLPDPYIPPVDTRLDRMLNWSSLFVGRHRKSLFWLITAVVVFFAFGTFRLEVETDFSKNFRASSPMVAGLEFVESRMGGTSSWEVNFPAPDPLTEDYLDQVRKFADDLKTIEVNGKPGLTKVITLSDTLDIIPVVNPFGNRLRAKLERLQEYQPELLPGLYNAEKNRMRVILRSLERQPSAQKRYLLEEVTRTSSKYFPEHKVTGTFVLFTFLIESLLGDQLISFSISAAAIMTMMMVAFRSVRIGLLSLIPNGFPIVLLMGGLGWIGSPINMGTAMIASVSMGLTVDSSIHYITGYLRARKKGLSIAQALDETQSNVGEALVFATFALIAGFSVLTISQFIPLVYFGLLVSLAMLGGLIGNLVLLPILLRTLKV
ncbi:MAG: MMPL family transporter [Planctomycetota bacterium]|nr:MMPL family transporter [Planctomycetota bacterium]MDA1212008.1 MMPL family transporter [Planctomycetota bacterium]